MSTTILWSLALPKKARVVTLAHPFSKISFTASVIRSDSSLLALKLQDPPFNSVMEDQTGQIGDPHVPHGQAPGDEHDGNVGTAVRPSGWPRIAAFLASQRGEETLDSEPGRKKNLTDSSSLVIIVYR